MAAERRQFVRCPMRLNTSYTILGTKKLGKSLTTNISGGGIRFVAEHALAKGTRLDVVMRLPERHEPVRFLGEVVWSEPARQADRALQGYATEVGVQFREIDPKDLAFLSQYVALYAPPGAGSSDADTQTKIG